MKMPGRLARAWAMQDAKGVPQKKDLEALRADLEAVAVAAYSYLFHREAGHDFSEVRALNDLGQALARPGVKAILDNQATARAPSTGDDGGICSGKR